MADVPESGFRKFQCHAITNKYPEAASAVQQVHKVLSDTENLAGCTPAKVGESSEWPSIVSSAEENRASFCEVLDGKPLFSALNGMDTVTLNELKAVLKMSAEGGQSGAVKSTAQDDDFREVKRQKRHSSIAV
jgi:hypothetical protein